MPRRLRGTHQAKDPAEAETEDLADDSMDGNWQEWEGLRSPFSLPTVGKL